MFFGFLVLLKINRFHFQYVFFFSVVVSENHFLFEAFRSFVSYTLVKLVFWLFPAWISSSFPFFFFNAENEPSSDHFLTLDEISLKGKKGSMMIAKILRAVGLVLTLDLLIQGASQSASLSISLLIISCWWTSKRFNRDFDFFFPTLTSLFRRVLQHFQLGAIFYFAYNSEKQEDKFWIQSFT